MPSKKSKKTRWIWILIFIIIVVGYYYTGLPEEKIPTEPTEQAVMGETTEATVMPSQVYSKGDYYELYFTDPRNPTDNTVEQSLVGKIDDSKKSIDMAVFEFDIESVAQAIIRAESRGVDVRVVYDNEYSDTDPQMKEIVSSGVTAIPDNRSGLMHNKFFVFDDACVWTGSFNISNNASQKNNENAIYFCSPEAAQNYSTEFDEMFRGEFGISSTSNTPYPSFNLNGFTVKNCFAAEDNCMDEVIKTVKTADTSIHFMAFSFTDDNLGQAMIDRANEGVIVEGIFESRGANTEYSECATLLNKGFEIRLDGNPATFHHKVIIVDGEFVIFGSYNFSANADKNNDENLLIWYDTTLAQAFEQQYQLMKSQSVAPSGNSCSK